MKRIGLLLALLGAGLLLGAMTGPRSSEATPTAVDHRSTRATPRSGSRPERTSALADPGELDPITALPRGSSQSLEVVELAYRIPIPEIKAWLRGDQVRALSWAHGTILRQILHERWLAAEPAAFTRFMVSRGPVSVRNMIRYLEAWSAVDREGAFHFVRSLPADDAGRNAANALIALVAKTDATASLALYEEFRNTGKRVTAQIHTLVRTDRTTLQEWVRQLPDPDQRCRSYAQAARSALREDFPWAIEMLQESGLGWRGLTAIHLPSSDNQLGEVFLEHIGEIPPEWIPEIAGRRGILSSGNEMEWLQLREHPDLVPEHLTAIQDRAVEWPLWKIGQRRLEMIELVELGTWLSHDARLGLRNRIIAEWHDNRADANAWLSTLPPEFQKGMEDRLKAP